MGHKCALFRVGAAQFLVLVLVVLALAVVLVWLLRSCGQDGGSGIGLKVGKPSITSAHTNTPAKAATGDSNSGDTTRPSTPDKTKTPSVIAVPVGIVETPDAVQVNIRLVDSGMQFEGRPLSKVGLVELVLRLHTERPARKPIQIIAHEDREARWAALEQAQAAVGELQHLPDRPVQLLTHSTTGPTRN